MLKGIKDNKGKVWDGQMAGGFEFPQIEDLTSLTSESSSFPPAPPHAPLLVCLSFKQFGFNMLPSWITPLCPLVDVRQLVIGEGGILKIFTGFLRASLCKAVPEEQHKTTYM